MTGKKKIRLTLGRKVTLAILLLSFVLAAVGIFLGYRFYADAMDVHYGELATNIARTAASQMDGDALDRYLVYDEATGDYRAGEKDAEYNRLYQILWDIKSNNKVEWLYISMIDLEHGWDYCVMDADASNTGRALGDRIPFNDANAGVTDLTKINGPTINYTDEWGWLCTVYVPIFRSDGTVSCMVGADVTMTEIANDEIEFLVRTGSVMLAVAVALALLFLWLTKKSVVKPVNELASAAGDFVSDREGRGANGESAISRLDIRTGDEIQNLSEAIKTMESDINAYIDNLTAVTAEKERIGAELDVAKQIQSSMLPSIFPPYPDRSEFDIYASMHPAKEVGGDFYDFFLIDSERLGVVMADVSGKGVPAALFMVIAKTLIKNQAGATPSPAAICSVVNDKLCENNDAGMFVTAFLGILEIPTGRFTFSNAGHNYPLVYRSGVGYDWLKTPPSFVLAGMEDIPYTDHEITLGVGDRLFLYTDGVTEALNPAEELYGDDRLIRTLNGADFASADCRSVIGLMSDDVKRFADGAEQADDITMLALEIREIKK